MTPREEQLEHIRRYITLNYGTAQQRLRVGNWYDHGADICGEDDA